MNLSKSGLGVSAGIKGLRAGVDAKGRRYVAGGRGGLYFREYLKPGEQAPTSPPGVEDAPRRFGWFVVAIMVVLVFFGLAAR